jgi:single-stranded-DNA-specific exonuclease
VDYLVPDRRVLGHGLSPELVDLAAARGPDLLVTVDNGIASVEGVARARALGLATLVTDHHLPGDELPAADCIVNPNQPGCTFPSRAISGTGVMFYVMLALRAELRRRKAFAGREEPNLAALADLVALGTVADVVPLDANNRILVAQGLKRLRAGAGKPGIVALLDAAGRDASRASCFDLGFVVGPRLNAAGRLADMSLGIECLLADDPVRAANCARELDRLNRERQRIEGGMLEEALAGLEAPEDSGACALALYRPGWHAGVVGLIASRVRERTGRPTVCFARAGAGELRGSGRSIAGLNLRDCLDLVAKRNPGLVPRFGGHAQAAGLTIRERDFERFAVAFERAAAELLPESARRRVLETDGRLEPEYHSLEVAEMLEAAIWGPGFPQPLFWDTFAVESQRVVGGRHLKLALVKDGRRFEAMRFRSSEFLGASIRAAYRLGVNEFDGMKSVQLNLEYTECDS